MSFARTGQEISAQSTSSVTSFTTGSLTVTATNSAVACMSSSTTSATLDASSTPSSTWATSIVNSLANGSTSIARTVSLAGGSTTFTVTPSAAQFVSIGVVEYTGMATTTPDEATNSATATSLNVNPGAVNPASTGDLYVACWTHNGAADQTFTFNVSGEGWTARANLTLTANQPLGSQDLINASGSKTGSATISSGPPVWVAAVATYKAAPVVVVAQNYKAVDIVC